jgi:hypothetical protein
LQCGGDAGQAVGEGAFGRQVKVVDWRLDEENVGHDEKVPGSAFAVQRLKESNGGDQNRPVCELSFLIWVIRICFLFPEPFHPLT